MKHIIKKTLTLFTLITVQLTLSAVSPIAEYFTSALTGAEKLEKLKEINYELAGSKEFFLSTEDYQTSGSSIAVNYFVKYQATKEEVGDSLSSKYKDAYISLVYTTQNSIFMKNIPYRWQVVYKEFEIKESILKNIFNSTSPITAVHMNNNQTIISAAFKNMTLAVFGLNPEIAQEGIISIKTLDFSHEFLTDEDGIFFISNIPNSDTLIISPSKLKMHKIDRITGDFDSYDNPIDNILHLKMAYYKDIMSERAKNDVTKNTRFIATGKSNHINFVGDFTTMLPLRFFSIKFFRMYHEKATGVNDVVSCLEFYGYFPKSQYYLMNNQDKNYVYIYTTTFNKVDDIRETIESGIKIIKWVESTSYVYLSNQALHCEMWSLISFEGSSDSIECSRDFYNGEMMDIVIYDLEMGLNLEKNGNEGYVRIPLVMKDRRIGLGWQVDRTNSNWETELVSFLGPECKEGKTEYPILLYSRLNACEKCRDGYVLDSENNYVCLKKNEIGMDDSPKWEPPNPRANDFDDNGCFPGFDINDLGLCQECPYNSDNENIIPPLEFKCDSCYSFNEGGKRVGLLLITPFHRFYFCNNFNPFSFNRNDYNKKYEYKVGTEDNSIPHEVKSEFAYKFFYNEDSPSKSFFQSTFSGTISTIQDSNRFPDCLDVDVTVENNQISSDITTSGDYNVNYIKDLPQEEEFIDKDKEYEYLLKVFYEENDFAYQCTYNCDVGYFYDSRKMGCFSCSHGCAECEEYKNCKTCNPGWKITEEGGCTQNCRNGTFIEAFKGTCKNCSSNCNFCKEDLIARKFIEEENLDFTGQCTECSVDTDIIDRKTGKCTSDIACDEPGRFMTEIENKITYKKTRICGFCLTENCKKCNTTETSKCLECIDNYVLKSDKCTLFKRDGYYYAYWVVGILTGVIIFGLVMWFIIEKKVERQQKDRKLLMARQVKKAMKSLMHKSTTHVDKLFKGIGKNMRKDVFDMDEIVLDGEIEMRVKSTRKDYKMGSRVEKKTEMKKVRNYLLILNIFRILMNINFSKKKV